MTSPFFSELFAAHPIMIILRGQQPAEAVSLANKAWDLGLTAIEVPVQIPEAVASLRAVVEAGRERGMLVGAGTVISLDQVREVSHAGAAFTVAPGLDVAVAQASTEAGMPHIPGVGSASDIQLALANGLSWVKAFPASSLGLSWFQAMRGPFPALNIVATGGVNPHNLADFLAAGASAVGLGSVLNDPASIDQLKSFLQESASV